MIIYSPERGGLGDGIVGCSSAFVLSICLEEEFKILNGSIKFNNYFDIPEKYKLSKIKYSKKFNYEPSKKHDYIFKNNNLNFLKNHLIIAGSNFSRFIYRNKNYKINIEEENIIKYLFLNILIPKKIYMDKLNFYNNKYNISESILLQIRTLKFKNLKDVNNPLHTDTIIKFINCFKKLGGKDKCILVSDNIDLVKPLLEKEGIKNIVIIDGEISHSLKMHNINHEKIILDMLLIGIAKYSIISYWSNFGRLGILRTKLNNFWLVEPKFEQMIENGKDLRTMCRDKNDPLVENFRIGKFSEILSKDKSYI